MPNIRFTVKNNHRVLTFIIRQNGLYHHDNQLQSIAIIISINNRILNIFKTSIMAR